MCAGIYKYIYDDPACDYKSFVINRAFLQDATAYTRSPKIAQGRSGSLSSTQGRSGTLKVPQRNQLLIENFKVSLQSLLLITLMRKLTFNSRRPGATLYMCPWTSWGQKINFHTKINKQKHAF